MYETRMFPRVDMVISRRQRHSFNIEPFHKAIFALKIETFPSARELWRIYIIINFPSSSSLAAASIVCAAEFHRIMPTTSGATFFFQVSFYLLRRFISSRRFAISIVQKKISFFLLDIKQRRAENSAGRV